MVRKRWLLGVFLLTAIMLLLLVQAESPSQIIQQQTGVDPDTAKQDVQKAKEEFLKKNWGEVLANNKILGPIHRFFTSISPVFQVLFAMPYSVSFILFLVILMWIYVVKSVHSAFTAADFINGPVRLIIAIATGIILAQIKVFLFIATWCEELIVSKDLWWMRLIIILIIVVVAYLAMYMSALLSKVIKMQRMQNKENQKDEALKQVKGFVKGVSAGREATRR